MSLPSRVLDTLYRAYGPQRWWPAPTRFEMMVGAILTQNTAWTNVEKALELLKSEVSTLEARALLALPPERLAELIRPSGYFRLKTGRLRALCQWFVAAGGFEALDHWPAQALREELLGVYGVGRETADSILLYAFERPVMVVDAYTRRIFSRLGAVSPEIGYEPLREWLEAGLGEQQRVVRYNELHALLVRHAKVACRVRPDCAQCVLRRDCAYPLN